MNRSNAGFLIFVLGGFVFLSVVSFSAEAWEVPQRFLSEPEMAWQLNNPIDESEVWKSNKGFLPEIGSSWREKRPDETLLLAEAGETSSSNDGAEGQGVMDAGEASRQFANPLTKFTLFITETNNVFSKGDIAEDTKFSNITVIEPLIPIPLGKTDWYMVNRIVAPIGFGVDTPTTPKGDGNFNFDSHSGLGDVTLFSLFTPPGRKVGEDAQFFWGLGPTFRFSTATEEELGSGRSSAGPVGVALYSSKKLTVGTLSQHWWSYDGNDDREDVNLTSIQYFLFYNFTPAWAFGTAPIATIDWEADDSDNKYSIPVGAGVAHTFFIGKTPSRLLLEGQYYPIHQDDFGPRWNIRLAWAMFLPSIVGK